MTSAGSRCESHPRRGPGGLDIIGSFEAVGSTHCDVWGRCRACGGWIWFATDLGGKYEYVGEKEIDAALAERAFVARDLDAVAEVFLRHDLPRGPVWDIDEARVDLLQELAPGKTPRDLADALAPARPPSPWARIRELLRTRDEADRASGRAPGAAPPLAFALDIECHSAGIEDMFELPGALILYRTEPPFEVIRVDAGGTVVRIMLPSRPRLLARSERRVIWALAGEAGEVVLTMGPDGAAHVFPEAPEHYLAQELDDDYWLFAPQGSEATGWAEIRRPDVKQVAKLLYAAQGAKGGSWYPPPPRRMAGGWVASGVLDLHGEPVALSLFDEGFQLIARSDGAGEARLLAAHDDTTVLATSLRAPFTLEAWTRDGARFSPRWSREGRAWVSAGDHLAVLTYGALVGMDIDGTERWSMSTGDALYLASSGSLAIAYGADGAVVVDVRTGELARRIPFKMRSGVQELRVDKTGAAYLRDDRELWIIHQGAVRSALLPFKAELLTTAGDAALLGDTEKGRYALIGADGQLRAEFEAEGARFSVTGTRAGPCILEPRRLRIAAFCASGATP